LHAALSNVDKLLDEARQKASIGDLDSAADLYQQVLALEKNHPDAKNELAVVLTGTQVSDNYIEETDDLKRDEVTKNTIQSSQ
jgi:thioredoxin-like negative regulator of GroEL